MSISFTVILHVLNGLTNSVSSILFRSFHWSHNLNHKSQATDSFSVFQSEHLVINLFITQYSCSAIFTTVCTSFLTSGSSLGISPTQRTSLVQESSFRHRKSGPLIHLLLSKTASALKALVASSAALHLVQT